MTLLLLILVPLAGIGAGFVLRKKLPRLLVIVAVAAVHLALTARLWWLPAVAPELGGYLGLDALGLVFLSAVSVVFAAIAVYTVQYRRVTPPENASRVYLPCNLLLLATLTALTLGRHMGLLWVLAGLSTLGLVPLMYLSRSDRALEATWKYVVICSVGVGFALLGIFFLGIAGTDPTGAAPSSGLFLDELLLRARAGRLDRAWLRAGFVLMLVGFGTKAGLSPMHTWKPDAYGEAPTPVAALMATAVCSCMLLCLLRAFQICVAAGQGPFASSLLVALGLLSVATGAAFVVAQGDFVRLLAYSGVEHMGVMALGVGIGGSAIYGAIFHMVGHTLIKGALFFTAGNVRLAYGTRSIAGTTGVLRRLPVSGALLFAGTFASLGFPPFSMFASELTILRGALDTGQYVAATLYLLLLGIVFVAIMSIVQEMVQGEPPEGARGPIKESLLLTLPAVALLGLALWLGLHVPPGLDRALDASAKLLGG